MAEDHMDRWLTERFAVSRNVTDNGFSTLVLAQLAARARRDRIRSWLVLPVMVLGAVLTAGQATPLADQLLMLWPAGSQLPNTSDLLAMIESQNTSTLLVAAGGLLSLAAVTFMATDNG